MHTFLRLPPKTQKFGAGFILFLLFLPVFFGGDRENPSVEALLTSQPATGR